MIVWISREMAKAIHDRQLVEHGGGSGVRDARLLESALARPKQLQAYGDPPADLAELAASLAHGLARIHPFVDGNKRTAAVACETFIELNGAQLLASDVEMFPMFQALAKGKLNANAFAAWLRPRLRIAGQEQVQEPSASYKKPRPTSRKKRL